MANPFTNSLLGLAEEIAAKRPIATNPEAERLFRRELTSRFVSLDATPPTWIAALVEAIVLREREKHRHEELRAAVVSGCADIESTYVNVAFTRESYDRLIGEFPKWYKKGE